MSGNEELFNLASKNFEQYLKDFLDNGVARSLPRARLNAWQWYELNRELIRYGVCMLPFEQDGVSYMEFSALPKRSRGDVATISNLDLGTKLKKYTGISWEHKTPQTSALGYEHYRIQIDGLSQEQLSHILDGLYANAIFDANSVYTNKGQFLIVKASDPVLDSVLDYYATVDFNGVSAYIYESQGMDQNAAWNYARHIEKYGKHCAYALNKTGFINSDYIVIAIKKSDADRLGCEYWLGVPILPRDTGNSLKRLRGCVGTPLGQINGMQILIESTADYGAYSNRPIILVSVGGKKIPFYISSGTGGKTSVPTGKWEFFAGVDKNGWLRKGGPLDVVSHYNSPELKQIAAILDERIGDLRDSTNVLCTVGRNYLGGDGIVAEALNMPEISAEQINQHVFSPENLSDLYSDVEAIKKYLRGGARTDIAQQLNRGTESLKPKVYSRVTSLSGNTSKDM